MGSAEAQVLRHSSTPNTHADGDRDSVAAGAYLWGAVVSTSLPKHT
jgi:hypothetical protein